MARTPLETVLFWFSVASFRIKKTGAATGPIHHAIRISSRLKRRASSRESASSGISIHGWSFGSYSGVFGSSGMADPFFQIFSISGIPSCERIPDIGVNIKGNKIAFLFKVCILDSVSLAPSVEQICCCLIILVVRRGRFFPDHGPPGTHLHPKSGPEGTVLSGPLVRDLG